MTDQRFRVQQLPIRPLHALHETDSSRSSPYPGEARRLFSSLLGRLLGYAHTRREEDIADQHLALRAAGYVDLFSDERRRRDSPRPELDRALAALRPRDTLVVCTFIRVARSLNHLTSTLRELDRREIYFRSLRESLDTADPVQRRWLAYRLDALERARWFDASGNRKQAAVDAKRRGDRVGRRPVLTRAQVDRARGRAN